MKFSSSQSLRRKVTIAVWILGLLLATALIARRPTSQIRGLAWAEPVTLSAPANAALMEFEVGLHESVGAGDLIARFDPAVLTARHSVILAEVEALTQTHLDDRQGRARVFERDSEEARLELEELRAKVIEGEARVDALNEEMAIEDRLADQGITATERAQAVQREINVVQARLDADRQRLTLAQRSADQATNRAAAAPGDNQWQIEAARRELGELEKRIARLSLRSSISGQLTEVYSRPGEFLKAGERVARITPIVANEVHAWMDLSAAPRVGAGVPAEIRRSSGERLNGIVKTVGAERRELPRSLWVRSNAPEWGYLLRIEIADGSLAPGEPVQIGLRPSTS